MADYKFEFDGNQYSVNEYGFDDEGLPIDRHGNPLDTDYSAEILCDGKLVGEYGYCECQEICYCDDDDVPIWLRTPSGNKWYGTLNPEDYSPGGAMKKLREVFLSDESKQS